MGEVVFSKADHEYMQMALDQAKLAYEVGEVPVGAVIVKDDEVIAKTYNQPIGLSDPTAHAEVLALRQAAKQQSNYRIPGATLYVTLEPCSMCAGAMVHARISRLVYAATEPKAGSVHSKTQFFDQEYLNHRPKVDSGLMADEASSLLSDFFAMRRQAKRSQS